MKKTYLYLILIFVLGLFLRFYRLGAVPAGFQTDEAYFGYNAFSILKTGREMTGGFLPINLKSFLYSPAGYSYFSIPFVFLFGLNAFSVRFASALFSSLTVIATYVLVLKLFKNFKNKNCLGLVASFFIAISPWNINLARTATESSLVVFFMTLGIIFYLEWLEKKKYYLAVLSLLSFAVTILTYQAPRSFLPLFIPLLFIVLTKNILSKRNLIFVAGFLLLIVLPVVLVLLSPTLSYRIRSLSITENPQTQLVLNEQLREDGVSGLTSLQARIFNNKGISYANTFMQNYFAHFSYSFLFTDAGFPDRYRVPSMGLLYIFELPLIIWGVYEIFSKDKKLGFLVVGWILLAPIGSALTFDDVPNLQRTLLIFPALSMLVALGFLALVNFLKKIETGYILKLTYVLLGAFIAYNFLYYLQAYYVHQVVHRPWYREEGYQKLISEINNYSKNYNKIVITNWEGNPTIFLFFYNKLNPSLAQKIIRGGNNSDYGNLSFGKYAITPEECPVKEVQMVNEITGITSSVLTGEKGTLYVDHGDCRVPQGATLLSDIKRSDNTSVFKLIILK